MPPNTDDAKIKIVLDTDEALRKARELKSESEGRPRTKRQREREKARTRGPAKSPRRKSPFINTAGSLAVGGFGVAAALGGALFVEDTVLPIIRSAIGELPAIQDLQKRLEVAETTVGGLASAMRTVTKMTTGLDIEEISDSVAEKLGSDKLEQALGETRSIGDAITNIEAMTATVGSLKNAMKYLVLSGSDVDLDEFQSLFGRSYAIQRAELMRERYARRKYAESIGRFTKDFLSSPGR